MTHEPEVPPPWVNGPELDQTTPPPPAPGLGARVWYFFLGLPRKLQLAVAAVLVAAVGRVTGVDDAVVQAVFAAFADQSMSAPAEPEPEPAPLPARKCASRPGLEALEQERLDQAALEHR